MNRIIPLIAAIPALFAVTSLTAQCKEFHVSVHGSDNHQGTIEQPYKTITAAANIAQPGDVITVHSGTYRESIAPPRGGNSDQQRILYQAAEGEKVIIKGSERITGWKKLSADTWQVNVDNQFFGDFNPYSDVISGDWFTDNGRTHHTGTVYLNNHWLDEAETLEDVHQAIDDKPLWFAQVGDKQTTIWAQFKNIDPNKESVEINVRQSVFYPDKTGVDFITVKGFSLMHAATPWAPPTAEQIGLIGTHWSKGWVIENNVISYSRLTCVTLGKYGDKWDNTSADTADGYVKTIERALENGWSKDNVGSHTIRNNKISHCGQAGIVGSLGAAFSEVSYNEIHDIHTSDAFDGAEIAAIKFHAPIDSLIMGNHIYNSFRGIWLDWMTQGARVTKNFLHDNTGSQDIFMEVNHGPFIVDHNIALSTYGKDPFWLKKYMFTNYMPWHMKRSVLDMSQGGTYAHNIFAGGVMLKDELGRETPYLQPGSTKVLGLKPITGGDSRYYNNMLVNRGFDRYGDESMTTWLSGNVYLGEAEISPMDNAPLALPEPEIKIIEKEDGWYLQLNAKNDFTTNVTRELITSEMLGKTRTGDLAFTSPDGTVITMDKDYLGQDRNIKSPFPGPFTLDSVNETLIKVWPISN
jgi:alpha-N-arabinofuranosidase